MQRVAALPGLRASPALARRGCTPARRALAVRAAVANPEAPPTIADTAYTALQGVKGVTLVSTQQEVAVTDLIDAAPGGRFVLAFGRSMGALAQQLQSELRPALDAKGIPLYLVSIGTPARGTAFCEKTGFDPGRLLADPDSASYPVLSMAKGLKETFLSADTPRAIWADMRSGRIETLKGVMKVWTKQELWIPPRQDQALQQGGVAVFHGRRAVWIWRDPATGAHADFTQVLDVATQGL